MREELGAAAAEALRRKEVERQKQEILDFQLEEPEDQQYEQVPTSLK